MIVKESNAKKKCKKCEAEKKTECQNMSLQIMKEHFERLFLRQFVIKLYVVIKKNHFPIFYAAVDCMENVKSCRKICEDIWETFLWATLWWT